MRRPERLNISPCNECIIWNREESFSIEFFKFHTRFERWWPQPFKNPGSVPWSFWVKLFVPFVLPNLELRLATHSRPLHSRESSQTFSSYHLVECGMVKEFNSSSSRVDGRRCIKTLLFCTINSLHLSALHYHDAGEFMTFPTHVIMLCCSCCCVYESGEWGEGVKSSHLALVHSIRRPDILK